MKNLGEKSGVCYESAGLAQKEGQHASDFAIHGVGVRLISDDAELANETQDELRRFHVGSLQSPDVTVCFHDSSHLQPDSDGKWGELDDTMVTMEISAVPDLPNYRLDMYGLPAWKLDEAILIIVNSIGQFVKFRLADSSKPIPGKSEEASVLAFHAAALGVDGTAIILTGHSGSGKTSLSYICASNGFRYLSDEDAFVKVTGDDYQVLPYPRRLRLDDETMQHWPDLLEQRMCVRRYSAMGQGGWLVDPCIETAEDPDSWQLRQILHLNNDLDAKEILFRRLPVAEANYELLRAFEPASTEGITGDTAVAYCNYNRQGFHTVSRLVDTFQIHSLTYDIRKHFRELPDAIRSFLLQRK